MGKKVYVVAGTLVLLLVVGGGVAFTMARHNQSNPTTLARAKAASSAALPACLAVTDDPALTIETQDQTHLVNAVIANIINVPAGTKVAVHIKTYDGDSATGSSVYAGNYGTYNFTARKTGTGAADSYQGNWKITDFAACQ